MQEVQRAAKTNAAAEDLDMYLVQSKDRFLTSEEAVHFILSVIAEAGLENEFEIIEIRDDLCGMIKDLWSSEEKVSEEFKELSEELTDPVQKLHAKNLSKEYDRHKERLYDLTKRLNCWGKSS